MLLSTYPILRSCDFVKRSRMLTLLISQEMERRERDKVAPAASIFLTARGLLLQINIDALQSDPEKGKTTRSKKTTFRRILLLLLQGLAVLPM